MDYFAFDFLTNPNKRVYWLYLLASIFLAFIYYYFSKKNSRVILSSKLWLHPSAKLDYIYFFLANLVNIFLLVPFILSAKNVALTSIIKGDVTINKMASAAPKPAP